MSKKLEDLFNLSSPTESVPLSKEDIDKIEQDKALLHEVDLTIDKIDAALPTVRDLEASDTEMDELAKLAQENFQNLMELGMSVDSRFSGTIFQTAGTLLGHAITAKQAKLDKKLRMVDLQIKKQQQDFKEQQAELKRLEGKPSGDELPLDGDGHVLDRNDIIAALLKKSSE
tara:strand:- start:1355 stop:1870 length:516 start_codon:yes stop_codon:yes gene_type:complete